MYTIEAVIERTMKSNNNWNTTYWNKLCVFCQVSTFLFTQHKNRLKIKRFEERSSQSMADRGLSQIQSLEGQYTTSCAPFFFFFFFFFFGPRMPFVQVSRWTKIINCCPLLSLLVQFPLWAQNSVVSIHSAAIKFFLLLRWESSADTIAGHEGLKISNLAFSPIASQLIPLSIQCQLVFQYQ